MRWFLVFQQNALNFGHAHWMEYAPMVTGYDQFALSSIQVTAPIGDDSIGANRFGVIKIPSLAAVCGKNMVGDSRFDGQGVDHM